MVSFKSITLSELLNLREEYFMDIRLSQELLIEWYVKAGKSFGIIKQSKTIGYFILSENNILLEFYLSSYYISEKESIFKQILDLYSISEILCKSFDSLLLTCSHTYSKSSQVYGTLFRDILPHIKEITIPQDINVKNAQTTDYPLLLSHDSELYETPEELKFMIANRSLYMFERNNELVGCGFLNHITSHKNYYDIGMWTNPKYRRQGYATMIISWLKTYCFNNNYIPVCGCAADNTASRKTLEKNGFISKHCLILFCM